MPRSSSKPYGQYSSAQRLDALRTLLSDRAVGLPVREIQARLELSRATVYRLLRAVRETGTLEESEVEGETCYRLAPTKGERSLRTNITQIVALQIARQTLAAFVGTGFERDIAEVYDMLAKTLGGKDAALARHLDRKLYDVGEAPFDLRGREDDVDEVLTALLHEQKLEIEYVADTKERRKVVLDPLTLMFYRRGLYLTGHSAFHGAMRKFGLDRIERARWLRGERFAYPEGYHPSQEIGNAFGIMRGEPTRVRIRFDASMSRYVLRRRWHATQRFETRADGSIDLHLQVDGTSDVRNWVLSFGAFAEVLEPATLRREIGDILAAAAARYQRDPDGVDPSTSG